MPTLELPNTIEADTTADAVEVEQNYQIIQQHVNSQLVNRDGSVAMAAPLLLVGDPTADRHAATKSYVDAILPVGVILPFGGLAAPAGRWALCNGASLAAGSYPKLRDVLNYRYGGTAGVTFNLPNLAARVPIGVDTTQDRFDVNGKTCGSFAAVNAAHTHTINHDHAQFTSSGATAGHTQTIPAHAHAMAHNHAAGTTGGASAYAHAHSIARFVTQSGTGNLGLQAGGTGQPMNLTDSDTGSGGVTHTHTFDVASYSGNTSNSATLTSGGHSVDHQHIINMPTFAGTSGSQGTAGAEQIPPFVTVQYIIRLD